MDWRAWIYHEKYFFFLEIYFFSKIYILLNVLFRTGKTGADRSTGFDFSPEIALLAIALELAGYLSKPNSE